MSDWINVPTRLALYLSLMLTFGLPFFVLHALRGQERFSSMADRMGRLAAFTALAGIVLSIASLIILSKAMTGAETYGEIGRHALGMVLTETDFGASWLIRVVTLAGCFVVALLLRNKAILRFSVISIAAAVALSTLAWTGHGAMSEGIGRSIHLSADILHLLAGGAWVGSLAAFILLLRGAGESTREHIDMLGRALNVFALIGTVIVLGLIVTGTINYWMTVGATLDGLSSTPYGLLLLVKLALFAMMLGLAAANRYRLSPLLERETRAGNYRVAIALLRKSLYAETSCAFLILISVSWLGMLAPMSN
ncbi:copper homeostasis membrane protein CopD [Bordetella sp. FB-8]|uniref:copper homeostasis membrane protein CopD n=1 Tax=Bordetella sp. FB-8 TaxID=1159870 RepID=UPI0003679B3E|nr:copper homeostasis membrane protein CopD [Bordetella sp. FB-8]